MKQKYLNVLNALASLGDLGKVRDMRDEIMEVVKEANLLLGEDVNIGDSINEVEANIDVSPIPADYDSSMIVANKFLYALNKAKRFLHFREAAEIIGKIEGLSRTEIDKLPLSFTNATRKLKTSGTIIPIPHNNMRAYTFWGLREWVDLLGHPIEEYKYDYENARRLKLK